MATSITVQQINNIENTQERVKKLKSLRKTLKMQMTNSHKWVNTFTAVQVNEIQSRLEQLNAIYDKMNVIQDLIDFNTEDEFIDDNVTYRNEYNNTFITIKTQMEQILQAETNKVSSLKQTVQMPNSGPSLPASNLNFVPLDEKEKISNFLKRLEIFMELKGIYDNTTRKYTLLHALSPLVHQRLNDWCAPDDPLTKTYEEIVTLLKSHMEPQPSVLARQHKFITREQYLGETVIEFSTELRKLSMDCKFNCSCGKSICDELLRLQFIKGLKDTEIKTRLLQDKDLRPFKEIIETASSIELAKSDNIMMSTKVTEHETYQVKHNNQSRNMPTGNQTSRSNYNPTYFDSLKGKCYRCGISEHRANVCPCKSKVCSLCNKEGHIARVCLSKGKFTKKNRNVPNANVHFTDENSFADIQDGRHEINLFSDNMKNDKFNINVLVENKNVCFELDTGASLTSISFNDFKRIFPNKRLFKTGVELRTYTGEIISPRGCTFAHCDYKGQKFVGKLYVINQDVEPIFGREWMREVQLDWAEIRTVDETQGTQLNALIEQFQDVFKNDIGAIPEYQAQLILQEGSRPIYIKPRQVPYALKNKIENEIERLENLNIISKVDHSEWGTPVVPVVKPNGSIRLCADYKVTLNKIIKDENHPIPRIEDIFSSMSGGKYFCTLDISNAYLHMVMNEESAKLQTLSTHKGLYKVNRLMFGVKVAPSLWQRYMDSILQGLDGVQCFFDDILIQGPTFEETLRRLRKVLEIVKKNNLRLNKDKSKFFQKSVQYLGHIIDENGLHKTPEKVKAIRNANRPTNVTELKSFLGLATYYNKFIKNFSNIVYPLTRLLQKNKPFIWNRECEKSFEKVKQEVTNETTLIHFNPDLQIVLATDASPVGLGAVLSHRLEDGTEKPIAFASRTLSKSETRYSQIDKEATAIFWGLKKFFPYCYGRKFTLITDHKPLVSIFDPHRTLPTMAATRIFNYAHFLSGFTYTVEFRPTEKHSNADFLSRFPVEKQGSNGLDDQMDTTSLFQINQIQTMPVTAKQIAEETIKEDGLRKIVEALKEGISLKNFGLEDLEYSLQDNCIFKGSRVIIPTCLQNKVLQELHVGHLGIVKMKALARSYCYWKNIDKDIENLAVTCKQCCLKQNNPPKVEIHPWKQPETPWERIHIDFAGPCFRNNYYFIVVDSFSKWVDVTQTKTITSDWCIKRLRTLFSTFGLPMILFSDNGSQFSSHVFQTFMKMNGIIHKTCAPFQPHSNGQAERFVQTVKKSLFAMVDKQGDMDTKIQELVMQLRNAPTATGVSAYNLMFGRNIRTKFDLMIPHQENVLTSFPEVTRKFKEGERVQARCYTRGEAKWKFGVVIKRQGTFLYLVKLDTGEIWRRHINQLLRSKFKGED
jgi:hypothetical protein